MKKDPKDMLSSELVVAIAEFRCGLMIVKIEDVPQEAIDRHVAIRKEFDLRFPKPE